MDTRKRRVVISAACAVLAALCVFGYTATIRSEAAMARAAAIQKYGGERVTVLIASEAIGVGQEITEANTIAEELPVDLLPQGEIALSHDQVTGTVAQVDIAKNEPVLLSRIGDGASRISVPKGLNAVSVSSDDVLAVGGAIRAGSFVDVYVETSKGQVTLLGQKILVLETNIEETTSAEKVSWVTLAVTSASVSDLLTASSKGTIHFVLPNSSSEKGQ